MGLTEIRNYLFSDLRSGEEELLQHGHKKRVIVAMRGLLHRMQNSRLTETEMATIRKGKLFQVFYRPALKAASDFLNTVLHKEHR
ncbi:hypothetical protein GEO37_22635 [Klebsiella pneumoniae]|nr:hypothetical protein [Klebsiella pneumoniae]